MLHRSPHILLWAYAYGPEGRRRQHSIQSIQQKISITSYKMQGTLEKDKIKILHYYLANYIN